MRSLVTCLVSVVGLTTPRVASAVCTGGAPNGVVAATEDCDDGNAIAGDGCSTACAIETEFSCARALALASLAPQDYPGSTGVWSAAGLEVTQADNTATPTVALFGSDARRGTYVIELDVRTALDDDFVGFVLGFAAGDATDPAASYLVIDWKQAAQSGVPEGLRLAHVRGSPNTGTHADHDIPQRTCANPTTACATQLAVGRRFGTVGWVDFVPRVAFVTYRADRLELRIDNVLELLVTPADFPGQFPGNVFPTGELGFYALSQEQSVYTDLAPRGASACNVTALAPVTLSRPLGTPSAIVDVATLLSDADDALDRASVVVRGVTGAATAAVTNGTLTVTPANPNVEASYTVRVFACDDDAVIADCDEAVVTVQYGNDLDGDGVIDRFDADDDDDGLLDADEPGDTDGDGRPDARDLDSDGDGVLDAAEAGHAALDADGDGVLDCQGGSGDNGACDAIESAPDSGSAAAPAPDGDGDAVADARDLDSDDDGIGDLAEAAACTDAAPVDSRCDGGDPDRDGIAASADGAPKFGGAGALTIDSDGDGTADLLDRDSDGDGIFDLDEAGLGASDRDDDGAIDRATGDDLDGDGLGGASDALPADFGGAGGGLDTDGDGTSDQRDLDADADTLPDRDEAGADPANPVDSEGDGTPDFQDPDSDDDTIGDAPDNCRFVANTDQLDRDGDDLGDACDPDADGDGLDDGLGLAGGGCASAGGGTAAGLLVLGLALLGLRRRASVLACVIVVAAAAPARAQLATSFPAERFQLTGHRDGILGVEWGDVSGHLTIDAGVWLGYADDPLAVYRMADDTRVASFVGGRVGGDLVAALRLYDVFELGVGAPLVIDQSPDAGMLGAVGELDAGLGDLRLVPKLAIARRPFALAIAATVTLPTTTSDYGGDVRATVAPSLIASRRFGDARASLVVGYRARERLAVSDLVIDDEAFAALGVAYRLARLELSTTFDVATAADDMFGVANRNFTELRGGASYDFGSTQVFVAVGGGLSRGFGAPDWRSLLGVRVDLSPGRARGRPGTPAIAHDGDGDGVADPGDRCPIEPEDRDGHDDGDGCPDPDDDGDGVLDTADACRAEPGVSELRGCPDPDGDGDRVVDRLDRCPGVAGVAPTGCADRDGDTVPDYRDNCPDQAGTVEHAGCATAQRVAIGDGKLELLELVYFGSASAQIEGKSYALLDNVATVLAAHAEITRIVVEGHTDDRGGADYNKQLSRRRAEAVVAYLAKRGIAANRLVAEGHGPDRPLAANTSELGRATNRRVELVFGPASGGP